MPGRIRPGSVILVGDPQIACHNRDLVLDAGIAMAIFAGAGSLLYFVVDAFRSDARRTRRVLRKTRVTPVAELVDNTLACVVGTVELDGAPLVSMITQKECVAFDTTIQMFAGNNFTVPERVDVTRQLVPFVVVDGTGRVRVDAPQAALCNRPIAKNERVEERIIEPGTLIRIVGSVRVEPVASTSGEHSYRESGATTVTLTGTSKYPLLIDVER
jgi:hypothetical protein